MKKLRLMQKTFRKRHLNWCWMEWQQDQNAGYAMFGEIPGNMLLAFEVQKK